MISIHGLWSGIEIKTNQQINRHFKLRLRQWKLLKFADLKSLNGGKQAKGILNCCSIAGLLSLIDLLQFNFISVCLKRQWIKPNNQIKQPAISSFTLVLGGFLLHFNSVSFQPRIVERAEIKQKLKINRNRYQEASINLFNLIKFQRLVACGFKLAGLPN